MVEYLFWNVEPMFLTFVTQCIGNRIRIVDLILGIVSGCRWLLNLFRISVFRFVVRCNAWPIMKFLPSGRKFPEALAKSFETIRFLPIPRSEALYFVFPFMIAYPWRIPSSSFRSCMVYPFFVNAALYSSHDHDDMDLRTFIQSRVTNGMLTFLTCFAVVHPRFLATLSAAH